MSKTTTINITHRVPRDDLAFGVVHAGGVVVTDSHRLLAGAPSAPATSKRNAPLASALTQCIEERQQPLDDESDVRRKAARDVLRNGGYKPTGRGKPANEYLLRAAQGESFPRINGPVDANNLVSLRFMVPISIWDVALAQSERFEMRLGREDERYIFNATGQLLELRDLVCGCALRAGESIPIVTPIKDSMTTKLVAGTQHLLGVIYFPLAAGGEALAREATAEFAQWLECCGDDVEVTQGLLLPGADLTL
ncbi:MAG: hypothetical protein JRH20_12475 [Deltaproteobacteria bacterium]|nr:hypothetical protein [Deltaproteobacteria bacterium]